MKIGFAQINTTVGDLPGNREQDPRRLRSPRRCWRRSRSYARARGCRLSAAGSRLQIALRSAKFRSPEAIARTRRPAALLVGFVDRNQGRGKPFHNAAALLEAGQPIRKTHKSLLPTYDVFDEDRYFEPARSVTPLQFAGKKSASPFAKTSGPNITCRDRSTTSSRCAAWSNKART